jgi:hypothetical protein
VAEATVTVAEVQAFPTRSGNTRFVVRDETGKEYTTFKEPIARAAIAVEGGRARIEYHEQERNGFQNVYLDRVEPIDEPDVEGGSEVEEVAWKTAIDAAPWLLGKAPAGGTSAEELFEKLQPFKELVAEDIRDDDVSE